MNNNNPTKFNVWMFVSIILAVALLWVLGNMFVKSMEPTVRSGSNVPQKTWYSVDFIEAKTVITPENSERLWRLQHNLSIPCMRMAGGIDKNRCISDAMETAKTILGTTRNIYGFQFCTNSFFGEFCTRLRPYTSEHIKIFDSLVTIQNKYRKKWCLTSLPLRKTSSERPKKFTEICSTTLNLFTRPDWRSWPSSAEFTALSSRLQQTTTMAKDAWCVPETSKRLGTIAWHPNPEKEQPLASVSETAEQTVLRNWSRRKPHPSPSERCQKKRLLPYRSYGRKDSIRTPEIKSGVSEMRTFWSGSNPPADDLASFYASTTMNYFPT